MAIHHHLPIYKQCYDLLTLASDVVRNMPRDFKSTLGKEINAECVRMLVLIARANACKGAARAAHITALLERLDVTSLLLRLGHDKRYVSHGAWARAAELLDSIGRQAGGWKRSAAPAA